MATILLQAGSFLGGFLGPVGTAIGAAAGAMAGYVIDRSLIDSTRHTEGSRLAGMQPFQAEEGAPLARVYGSMRVGGNVIWATRFEETQTTERQGGKGRGPKVTTYSYFCNVAFALCEGEIAGVRRIWADGREVDLAQVTVRIHRGGEAQDVDPLIAAKQGDGNTPAYKGVAYAVIDRFPLADYGNRIPQFQFEVLRPVSDLNAQVRSVVLIPGSTEYGLLPRPVVRIPAPGRTVQANRHVLHGVNDLVASLDELQMLCPNLEEVAVVVTWFGDDLRAGQCRIRPGVTERALPGYAEPWSVAGVSRAGAMEVSRVDGTPAYGGTPSDRSVMECIAEIRSRGLKVTLYPFVMMDVGPGNGLPDPYGGTEQAAFPWRGRITCDPAPGRTGSADKSAAARSQAAAFCGAVTPAQFAVVGTTVVYAGPAGDWGYRRMVLHYAKLAVAAGGVDGFLLGSELRGLTTLRDEGDAFPFVEALCELAGQVRATLGEGPAITYGADWTEYFGHQPADGSGDVFFHLDDLWAHEAVTAVGIDNYMPLSDWRDEDMDGGNPDGFAEPYDRDGLAGQIAGGEGYDWYYRDMEARRARERSPITDGAYGKPWVFRIKDIKGWWENAHYNRIGGVEQTAATAWTPRSKPVWFMELGCPAVDKGPNQPNVFPDAKSSEDAVPYFSSGHRSDIAQARFLAAHMDYWNFGGASFDPQNNPVSPVYGGRMVDPARFYLWAWDARPFPAFPQRADICADSDNWQRGHWLNGRLSSVPVGDLIRAVLADHGLPAADVGHVSGMLAGYVVRSPSTARAALEPVVDLHGIVVNDDAGTLVFRDEDLASPVAAIGDLVLPDGGTALERTRIPDRELPREAELVFIDAFRDYQSALVRIETDGRKGAGSGSLGLSGSLEHGVATGLMDRWVERRWTARERVSFAMPASAVGIAPGARVSLPGDGERTWLVSDVEQGLNRRVTARRTVARSSTGWPTGPIPPQPRLPVLSGQPYVLFLDLPALPSASNPEDQFRIAAFAHPWRSQSVYVSPEETGFAHAVDIARPATLGELVAPLAAAAGSRFDRHAEIVVRLYGGELSSASELQVLNGANTAAIRAGNGIWEVVQFTQAEEIAASVWRLRGLLRGQAGTADAVAAGAADGAPFVLLDDRVVKAGLPAGQAGIALNWRIGPAGYDFADPAFVATTESGGQRALLPLPPVHLRMTGEAGTGVTFGWTRCGRLDADSWLGEDIPLGEENELYRIEIAAAGGAMRRVADTTSPAWVYAAAQIGADFPDWPAQIEVTVRQLSGAVGAGLAARRRFTLH